MILKTERLILDPILESDLNTLHTILVDPFVRKYLCDDQVFSLEQVKGMIDQSQRLFEQENLGLWFIRRKADEETKVIGFVGLWYFFNEEHPQLLYALLPQALKQGYATEAAKRILIYCFEDLGFGSLLASCDPPNLESQKLAIRLGMHKIEEKTVDGQPLVFFSIDRSEFEVLS